MFNDLANLCKVNITQDNYGNEIQTLEKVEVFVETKSIGMRETYLAAQSNLKPEITLIIADASDYDGQTIVEYYNKLYTVARTYKNGHQIELTLVSKEGNE